jgi:uncharacterized protein (DUF2141 family)
MKKTLKHLCTYALAAAMAGMTLSATAANDNQNKTNHSASATKPSHVPFHGRVIAVDAVAKSFKLGDRTFVVTSETRIKKDGVPATFDDVKAGDNVGGAFRTANDGRLEVLTLNTGLKADAEKKKKKDGGTNSPAGQ